VAIVVDGTPFVLTAPYLFIEAFQTAEDYYFRPYFMSMLRIIRYIAYAITVTAPAIYVAITTFHQELIPTDLLFTMASAREGVPFPAVAEALVMLIAFEILREAGYAFLAQWARRWYRRRACNRPGGGIGGADRGADGDCSRHNGGVNLCCPRQADAAAVLRLIFLILAAIWAVSESQSVCSGRLYTWHHWNHSDYLISRRSFRLVLRIQRIPLYARPCG
jgi:spore germination protein KA